MSVNTKNYKYRHVFIVESTELWHIYCPDFDCTQDLVLTIDFGLKKHIESLGGEALFLDHLVAPEVMQQNNFLIYDFFQNWHFDKDGKDLFTYRGVPFGFSFRVDIWNDFTFYLRTRICVEEGLKALTFDKLYVGTQIGIVESILKELSIPYSSFTKTSASSEGYYFPIFRYMHENTRSFSWKSKLKDVFMLMQGSLMPKWDRLVGADKRKPLIFIHEYHPTRTILSKLRDAGKVRVLVERISATSGWTRYFTERPIPILGNVKAFLSDSSALMKNFIKHRHQSLTLSNGSDVSQSIYQIIEDKIDAELPNQIRMLDSIIDYVEANPVRMEVLIGNIGRFPTLLDCVLKQKNIPSYLIINGLLGPTYSDESKYATTINGYAESIKSKYFKGQSNVVCLGDPRMDAYAPIKQRKDEPTNIATITIGASGFNPVDLNSYVAVEFDFLFDVLQAIQSLKQGGLKARVIVKVRPNGYLAQYEKFTQEYFPELVDEIISSKSMREVLEDTDFYISIYSQTLFEASCLGVPVVYYKKDNEVMDPPFDGCSELVTVDSVGELKVVIQDFYSGSDSFSSFLRRSVMEKYIGHLDGGNVERNLEKINQIISIAESEKEK